MAVDNSPIVKEFLIESFESLSVIGEELTQYEKDGENAELLNAIYRKVHTIKGSASFLGLTKLQEITHSAENILDYLRDGTIKIDSIVIDVLLNSFDVSIEILKSIEEIGKENDVDYSDLHRDLVFVLERRALANELLRETSKLITEEDLQDTTAVVAPKEATPELEKEPVVAKTKEAVKPIEAAKPAEAVKPVEPPKPTPQAISNEVSNMEQENNSSDASSAPPSSSSSSSGGSLKDSVVRVNVQLLDKIMNVVGELVLNRNQILQFANAMDSSSLTRLAQQLNVITTELQTDIMTTRMQPVGSVLSKFERIVRDLSRSQNKTISLEISGKDTELDKTLLEAIRDPLTHLIRNGVDHGIEAPAERIKKGKPEQGNIKIKAYHEGGQVTIEINDDGNGIDPKKILKKAIQKGLYTEAQAADLSEKQILHLIFNPGFSTAEQVTNISGRGVGMDVVKSNIEKIGGSVDVFSRLGEGTTFKLKIPLTLAIVPALVVESFGETFAIPQINLVELVRLEGSEVTEAIEDIHNSEFFRLRGDLIPIFRLNNTLELEKVNYKINDAWLKQIADEKGDMKTVGDLSQAEISAQASEEKKNEHEDDSVNIVILNADGRIYGLIVDQISDTEEIVVKPLSRKLKDLNCFAGATIMGDGRVSLILDALGFFNSVDKGQKSKGDREGLGFDEKNFTVNAERQEILLTILGDDRPYGIPLVLVNRLEEFAVEDLEWSGNQPLIRYGNIPMPLVNLEKSLKLNGESLLDCKEERENNVLPCVVVKIRDLYFGLVVNEIHDIAISEERINSDTIDRDGLLGTIFVNGKTITLLDVHNILDLQKIGVNLRRKQENLITNKRGHVLLVDDSPLYRKIECEFLREQGFEVIEALDGKEGFEIFQSDPEKFTFVVTDIEMPVMDGFEMSEKIRGSGSHVPILALSTAVTDKDLEKGIKAGFNAHEEKFNRDSVLRVINELLAS